MGEERLLSAVLASIAGLFTGLLLFVPFVAVSYRRRGGLSAWRLMAWAAFLVYFFAIWTYTLLPLPDPETIRCVGAITDLSQVVRDVQTSFSGPGNPLRRPELQQLLLNVLLFVPLGFFVRGLLARGFVITVLSGFGVSLFIETTQLTGVWGVYPCAYRFFDVGDLLTNTVGAFLGAVLALLVPARVWGLSARAGRRVGEPVTRGRRLLVVICDVLAATVLSAAAGLVTQLVLQYVIGDRRAVLDGGVAGAVSSLTVVIVWFAVTMISGRSLGDHAVEVEYRGGGLPRWVARLLRFAGGVGGYHLLLLVLGDFPAAATVFAIVAVASVFMTRNGRGLPGVLSRQDLFDARARIDVPLEGADAGGIPADRNPQP